MLTTSAALRRALLAGAALATTVVLSSCADGAGTRGPGMGHGMGAPAASASAGAVFDTADVMFAHMMIPHHQQAIAMADLAPTRADSSEVKALAAKIKQAQQPEIDTMTGWLVAWGQPAPMPGMSAGTAVPGLSRGPMAGMMSASDLSALAGSTGSAFDKQFLTMMIPHHQGAITMAEWEQAHGANPDAKALAAKIITTQQAEIVTMQNLLKNG
ncbi:DUF305 domain-containing protein [Krasilnikovia sp. M28-CT-15]|uniref:DUF305 domain-containing protein n=1 Tax=Krasilnikovia sp. M28-CT-15 TaxID=3373540 RepID=UPI003875D358